jgi:oxygen-independent coproporphyrinogen-3 oxidase
VTREIPEKTYLSKLKSDLQADLIFVQGRPLKSIFFGGGTPSLMSGQFYSELIEFVSQHIAFAEDIEITLEANPGTTESSRFSDYAKAGINRLSLGVQSFQDKQLERLGRIHSSQDAINAIAQAQSAGITNCNIDLMHGLPEQSMGEAITDLKRAISLGPEHISWYQLTIEQNTEFYRYPPRLPLDEVLWDIQSKGLELLEESGFAQYEVSAFSKPGKASQHNLNYWRFGDYLGIGAGAHAKVTSLNLTHDDRHQTRYRKTRIPTDYLNASLNLATEPSYRIGEEVIARGEIGIEFLMNVLRLKQGVSESLFEQRTGLAISHIEPQLSELRQLGLIEKNTLCTTEKGHLFLNTVLEKFTNS